MDYSTAYFGKGLQDIDYQDIIRFFADPREESDKIEFKSYSIAHGNLNKSFDAINRGICAFLNSDGGILILGAPEGVIPAGSKEKIYQGDLTPVDEHWEKDKIINKVSDSITPLPVGVNVVILGQGSGFIYVFEIQPSDYSPHQYKDTYYARLDGQTKPAPHYLIEALFRKIRYPNIEGYISFKNLALNESQLILDISVFMFNFSPLQNEENVSFRLMCPAGIFARSQDPQFQNMYTFSGHQLVYKGFIDVLHFGTPNTHSERLIFDPHQLVSKYKNEVLLVLTFGGKYSPAKTSSYKLDFNKMDLDKPKQLNPMLNLCEENKLISDKQSDLGTTKDVILKDILGR